MVTRSILTRAITARVAEPGACVVSKLKSVRIGKVPDRGGVPEGYMKRAPASIEGKTRGIATARGPKRRPAVTETSGPIISTSSSSSDAITNVFPAGHPDAPSGSDGAAPPAQVAAKPRDKDGKTQDGARSSNKELAQEFKKNLGKPKEQ